MQPHPSKATHHLVHLGTEEEFWSHTKVKGGLESFHAESGDLQNHPAPALPLARDPRHKPPPQYSVVPGGLLGGVSHQHQTASSSVNRYPSRQAEEHEHVVTHKFSSLDLTKTEVVPGPAESALIPAAVVVSSQLGVDQIHPSDPLPSGIQDSADIDNPTPAAIAAAAPTLEEVSVVHQIGQEEGPPVLGGSCTSDPEGLVNGQVVGGFDNTLSKADCKPDPSHQVRVSGEESPPLSSTLENVEDFLVSTTASETTTAVEGDGFEGVGLVDNPVCYAAEQVAVRGNETSEVLEESSIQSNDQQTVKGQEDMQGSSSVMDTAVDGPLLPGSRAHKVADDAGDREENSAHACSTVVVEDPFIEEGPGLQSSAEIAAGVESDDGCIPGINSSISSSSLVLGKIDASSEAQSLKVLVARDVSFQAGSQLKDESSNQTQRESLEKVDASIDTTMCVEESADDKALKDTTLEEVQRTELPVHNPAVSGGDMNRDPPLPSAILGMTHQEHTEDWEVVAELPTPKSALLETLGSEANLEPSQTCREYSRDFLLVYRDRYHDLPGDFAIRQDVAELFSHPLGAGGSSGESSLDTSLSTPGQSLEQQQPSLATPVLDWRVGNSPGPLEEDGHTRAAGILSSSSSSSGHGYFGGDMIMAATEFRPPHGHFLPGLIPHLPLRPPPGLSHLTGMVSVLFAGGSVFAAASMIQFPNPIQSNCWDADHWQQRTPSEIRGLIPPPLPLPQHTAAPTIHKAKAPYEVGKVSDMEQIKQRQIKGILNKLTPQNFEKLFAQVKDVNIDSALTLMGVISQIFDKALTEPTFCEMYATFCAELAIVLPEFVEDDEKITFRRVLLNKCQEEFEHGELEQEEAEKVELEGETQLDPKEREEKRSSARRRMLGNIRFIGELYKKSMLTERIMHECIKKLLGEYQHPDEEDVEALCKLMRTIGHIIDHPKARDHIDAYFRRMESLSVNMELPSRIRFMLKDMIDLRRNGWQERRKVEGPKKIDEVRRDAVQERQQAMANTGGRDRFSRGSMIGGLGRGRIVPGSDFGMRGGPPAPLFPPNPRMAAGLIPSAMTLTSSEICSN
jgi:translation initiation factor 4G